MLSQVLIANWVLVANETGDVEGSDELIEKCGKLLKTRKLSKSQKLSKIGNCLSLKNRLSQEKNCQKMGITNFNDKENGPSFLIPNTTMAFNYLWLAFIKAAIL